ncbi:MAG: vitamin B12 dependent-methionine synthase activation domain-containing protein [Candidatus Krumholzibacteriaceae bacterium]
MAVCVSTIGPALEAEVTRLAGAGELLKAVVLDSIGSVAAEAVAEYIDRTIAAEAAREGLKTSCRASPGYGDWDVRGQAAIFRLLPAERIGVLLSETFMMAPRKSISFAMHVAGEPEKLRSENSCGNCGRTDCLYRLE